MKLTAFILPHCPYCRQAKELIGELRAERPELSAVEIEYIDESLQSELADRYDYYRVGKKLYEADPLWSREEARKRLSAMFDGVLA